MKYTYLLFILLFLSSACKDSKGHKQKIVAKSKTPSQIIVVLGSSTAAGTGPKTIDSAWVNLYQKHFNKLNKNYKVINLAKGGYTTYHIMPDNFNPPQKRFSSDHERNITKAISYKPDLIIINLPSNDAAYGFSVKEQMVNFATIDSICKEHKIELYITTTQPRNLNEKGKKELIELKDELIAKYKTHTIDFWSQIANQDGSINKIYGSGDGVHLNAKGHKILFNRVISKISIKNYKETE